MSKKSYWTSKAGKAAIQQAARTDAAGAMRVSPANQNSLGFAGGIPSRAPDMGIAPSSLPGRGTMQNFQNKLIAQGPTTGFGSFRTSASLGGPGVDLRGSPLARGINIRRV